MSEPEKQKPCLEIWKVVASRRQARDTMVWQTAALVFTGQAFLYSVALGKDAGLPSRLIALGLSIICALATMQVMAKHRELERLDSEWLVNFETENFKKNNPINIIHGKKTDQHERFWIRLSSVEVWLWLQFIFIMVSLILVFVLPVWEVAKAILNSCKHHCC